MTPKHFFFLLLFGLCLKPSNVFTQSTLKTFIIGGQSATEGEFPWIADFRQVDNIVPLGIHLCGGALIAPQWVLTAAHCTDDAGVGNIIRLNSINTNGSLNPNGGIEVGVIQKIQHPSRDSINGHGYDIALLKLATPVTSIAPVGIASQSDTVSAYLTNTSVNIAGWGVTNYDLNSSPDSLRWVTSHIYNFTLCKNLAIASNNMPVHYTNFCIGYTAGENPSGAASGDSGSPAWRELPNGSKEVTGVVSGGFSFITAVDSPGIFTKVAYVRDWIESVINTTTATNLTQIPPYLIDFLIEDEQLTLNFGEIKADDADIEIINMNATTVFATRLHQPNSKTLHIDLHHLASGVHIISIITSEGQILTQKFFKS